jgi:hypothetical protein
LLSLIAHSLKHKLVIQTLIEKFRPFASVRLAGKKLASAHSPRYQRFHENVADHGYLVVGSLSAALTSHVQRQDKAARTPRRLFL